MLVSHLHTALADTVTSTIQLGNQAPSAISTIPSTNKIYVASMGYAYLTPRYHNEPNNHVVVIDGATDSILGNITVGNEPAWIATNPSTNLIYTSNYADGTVSVIDGSNDAVVATISLAGYNGINAVAVNPSTDKIYVAAPGQESKVFVIDGKTNTIVDTIQLGYATQRIGGMTVNSNTNKIYATLFDDNKTVVIDGSTDAVVNAIQVGGSPNALTVNTNLNRIYVANTDSDSVSVIDGATDSVLDTVSTKSPMDIVANPSTNKVYAVSLAYDTVYIINGTADSVSTMTAPHPLSIGLNPSTDMIYVGNNAGGCCPAVSNSVTVIQGSPKTTSQLRVSSQDSFGNAITGFYTELYANNGTQLDAGYTPYNFTLDNSQNYTVHVEDYGNYRFNHWLDTGSTNASRTIQTSSDQSITAVYATIPTPPANLTATAVSSSEIDLNWNTPTSDGGSSITGYRIQQSTDDSTWTTIVKTTGNTNTAYNDTGLSDNTTYYYRVFALNSVGSSYRSDIATATTPILSVAGTNVGPVTTTLP